MQKSNAQKKAELQFLLTSIVNETSDNMPKGIGMLVKAITRQIDEQKIDEILDGILDFLSKAYVHVEKIRAEEIEVKQLEEHAA